MDVFGLDIPGLIISCFSMSLEGSVLRNMEGIGSESTMSSFTVIILIPFSLAAAESIWITLGLPVLKVPTCQAFSGVVDR